MAATQDSLDNFAHLLPPSWKTQITTWLQEDTPSFDYGGFVVGEAQRELPQVRGESVETPALGGGCASSCQRVGCSRHGAGSPPSAQKKPNAVPGHIPALSARRIVCKQSSVVTFTNHALPTYRQPNDI